MNIKSFLYDESIDSFVHELIVNINQRVAGRIRFYLFDVIHDSASIHSFVHHIQEETSHHLATYDY